MRYTVGFMCGLLSISTAGATVYSGTYTSGVSVVTNSSIESGTTFDNAELSKGNNSAITLTIGDGVQFINHAQGVFDGAAIYDGYASKFTININGDGTQFKDNYYGISIDGGATLTINGDGTQFKNNKSAISTADVTYYNSSNAHNNSGTGVIINGNNTLFDGNEYAPASSFQTSGAIYLAQGDFLTINGTGTVFSNNTTHYNGGAIYNSAATSTFNAPVVFDNNSAYGGGGAIYNTYFYDMYHAYTAHNAILYIGSDSSFNNNTSSSGGAIYNRANNQYSAYVFVGNQTLFSGNSASVNGGAIYNTGKNATVDIDTGTTFVTFATASDSIYNDGGVINFLGSGHVSAGLTSLTSSQGSCATCLPVISLGKASAVFDTVALQDNTILKTTVWKDGTTVKVGNIAANTFNIQNSDELKLQIAVENRQVLDVNGSELTILIDRTNAQAAGWDFFGNPNKHPTFELENNLLYDIEFVQDGVYKVTPKANPNTDPSDTSDVMDNVAQAWNVSGFETGSVSESIANQLYVLSQFDSSTDEYNAALGLIKPIESDVIDRVIKRNMHGVMNTISRRLYTNNYGLWTDAIYTHTQDKSNDFTSNTFGGVFGYDIDMNLLRLGYSFGYMKTYAEAGARKFDLDNNFNASIYSQFGIPIANSDLFINIIGNHSTYSITENKSVLGYNVDSDWDIAQTGIQGTIGLKYGLLGADVGVRDTITQYGSYMDSLGQHVDGVTDNALQFVANLNLTKSSARTSFGLYTGIEASVDSTDKRNIVTAPNSQRYFVKHTPSTSNVLTFGGDVNMKVTHSLSIGIACDGALWEDYLEYSGKLRFNYAM